MNITSIYLVLGQLIWTMAAVAYQVDLLNLNSEPEVGNVTLVNNTIIQLTIINVILLRFIWL